MIIAVTGPGGSGKSTVTDELMKKIPKAVHIKVDHVKHFIAFKDWEYQDLPRGNEQWRLLGENIALLADNFAKNGYNVVVDGYLNIPAWKELTEQLQLDYKFLLLPNLETCIKRDAKRPEDWLGKEMVTQHHSFFSKDSFFKDFIKIDSSSQAADETAAEILEQIGKLDSTLVK